MIQQGQVFELKTQGQTKAWQQVEVAAQLEPVYRDGDLRSSDRSSTSTSGRHTSRPGSSLSAATAAQ